MSTLPSKRSHNGCWTCKRRRRKCDETRPSCRKCDNDGVVCEGYEQRLRWGTGVASRGHLAGAQEPVQEKAPTRQKGRQRDRERAEKQKQKETVLVHTDTEDVTPLFEDNMLDLNESSIDVMDMMLESWPDDDLQRIKLFKEFLTSGHMILHSATVHDNPLIPMIPQLCRHSQTLYNIVVALQAYLSKQPSKIFFEYYDRALILFRADVDNPIQQSGDAILISALLLCTIGMLQGTPWTIHLRGMEKLLQERSRRSPRMVPSSHSVEAVEVMGVMDIPTFVIGRQLDSLSVWRRYRSGKILPLTKGPDAVQPMSGLPRSLLDLFSYDGDLITEEALLLWPGFAGSVRQCQLWEAYRYTGMLDIRRRRNEGITFTSVHEITDHATGGRLMNLKLPDNAVLVARAISAMTVVAENNTKAIGEDILVANAALYPLFVLALEVVSSEAYAEWHSLVEKWFQWQVGLNHSTTTKLAWQVIQKVSDAKKHGVLASPDDIARERGIEIGLL